MEKKPLYELLRSDTRYLEGLHACINCGTCTAICPAAAVCDYDPRIIMDTVQQNDEGLLEHLLKSDVIWYCGECLSCKTRCPRNNTPGYIIQSLRALSIESGAFIQSREGRKQLAVKRTVGDHMLKYGYCVHIDEVDTRLYPEQGPVWDWLKQNKQQVLARLGCSYGKLQSGTLRQTSLESLNDLRRIFEETGAMSRFQQIEAHSAKEAAALGIEFDEDKDKYFYYIYNGE